MTVARTSSASDDAREPDQVERLRASRGAACPSRRPRRRSTVPIGHGQREDRKRGAALELRKVVRDERVRRRAAAGLADRRADARAEQHREVHRHAAQRRSPRSTARTTTRARCAGSTGRPTPRSECRGTSRRCANGRPLSMPELRVGGAELALDRLQRRRQHLRPIDDVGDVAERQQPEDVVPVPRLRQETRAVGSRLGAGGSRLDGSDCRLSTADW